MYWNSFVMFVIMKIWRWIVTLDVLKFITRFYIACLIWLNSNIRCIEMVCCRIFAACCLSWIVTLDVLKYRKVCKCEYEWKGWIVTLDVLKYYLSPGITFMEERWIVTLDVLKLISMSHKQTELLRWIVTLDVLKSGKQRLLS